MAWIVLGAGLAVAVWLASIFRKGGEDKVRADVSTEVARGAVQGAEIADRVRAMSDSELNDRLQKRSGH